MTGSVTKASGFGARTWRVTRKSPSASHKNASCIAKFRVPSCAAVQIRLFQLDEILRDVRLLCVVVAAHIDGVLRPGFVHHGHLHGLVGQAVRHVQYLLHAMDKGVAGVGDPQQQHFAVGCPQPVVAAAGSAGGVGVQLSFQIRSRPLAVSRHAVGGVQRAHHPGAMPEQLRQNAHTARAAAHIEHPVFLVDEPPCVGGQQQQALRKKLHPCVQNRVCAALHWADGLHGGMDQDGLVACQPHCCKVVLEVSLCICHVVSPFWAFCLYPVYRLLCGKASRYTKRHIPCCICRGRAGICGVCDLSAFLVKSCIQHIISPRYRETSTAPCNYSNLIVISCFLCAFGTAVT